MKGMTIAVMQPTYLPWLGYFDLIDQSDVFVFYDDVQFVKQSWQTRNQINTANGVIWIYVPVLKSPLETKISEIRIDNSKPWKKKTLATFENVYRKADYFTDIMDFLERVYSEDHEYLYQFNINFIKKVSHLLGINTVFKKSSSLENNSIDRINRLIEISKLNNCNSYLSTNGAKTYLNEENGDFRFKQSGVDLLFHNYEPFFYNSGKRDFIPFMSIVDCLFHCGSKKSLDITRKGRKPNKTIANNEIEY